MNWYLESYLQCPKNYLLSCGTPLDMPLDASSIELQGVVPAFGLTSVHERSREDSVKAVLSCKR